MTQNELNDFLAEHKEWLESKTEAIDEIWGKSSDEQRNSINTDWINELLREYKFKGKQLRLKNVNLSGLNLANSKYFVDLVFENVDLSNSNCANSRFGGSIKNVNFRKANLHKIIDKSQNFAFCFLKTNTRRRCCRDCQSVFRRGGQCGGKSIASKALYIHLKETENLPAQ